MRWAVPCSLLVLLLRAEPARYTLEGIRLRATAPLPDQQRELVLRRGRLPPQSITLLYADGRAHLALRDPLGLRGPSVRIADGMVGLVDRQTSWVAPDAVVGLQALLGDRVGPELLVDLALGRAPDGHWSRTSNGARVERDGLRAEVDREGRLRSARVGLLTLTVEGDDLRLGRAGLDLQLERGPPVYRPIPDSVFRMDATERLVWLGGQPVSRRPGRPAPGTAAPDSRSRRSPPAARAGPAAGR